MPGLTQRDWQNALDAQSACNIGGLAHDMTEVISRIREESDCTGTDYVNEHPIVVLYVTQMIWLSMGSISPDPAEGRLSYSRAYTLCLAGADAPLDSGVRS